jgi:Na+-translocating ferredoxin:NAD+ oxidoreductase RnfD subunit
LVVIATDGPTNCADVAGRRICSASSSLLKPDLPPIAAIAAVCTVGYFGFLLGPPMIGGLAELIGLPAALGLVVLLCALIAALGSRAPPQRASAPAHSSG